MVLSSGFKTQLNCYLCRTLHLFTLTKIFLFVTFGSFHYDTIRSSKLTNEKSHHQLDYISYFLTYTKQFNNFKYLFQLSNSQFKHKSIYKQIYECCKRNDKIFIINVAYFTPFSINVKKFNNVYQ